MPPLIGSQAVRNGVIGRFLQVQVERSFYLQAGLVHLLGAEAFFQLFPDLLLKPRRDRRFGLGNAQPQRGVASLLCLLVGDNPVKFHLREHQVAPAQCSFRCEQRRETDGPLGQSGQQSRLGQRQIFGVLAEEKLRCGLEAVPSVAQVDLVAIEGKDLLLGEGALNLNGQISLLHLAAGGAFGGEKEVARQLHGQRGCALSAPAASEVVPQRSADAKNVDAPVRLKALVFNRDHGLAQHRRKVVIVDHYAPLQRKGADDATLLVIEIGGGRRLIAFQVVNLGQIDGVDQHEPAQRAGNHGQNKQRGEGQFSGQFAPPMLGRRLSSKQMGPAKAAHLGRIDTCDSQAIQASRAILPQRAKKCFSIRLAWMRSWD